MSLRPRRAGMRVLRAYGFPVALCLAMLLTFAPGAAFAQDATPEVTPASTSAPEATAAPVSLPERIIGSGIAAPLFNTFASQAGVALTVDVTGTNSGITDFCSGQAAATLATRALTPAEQEACGLHGVNFQEVLIAHSAAAIIVNSANDFVQCYTTDQLAPLFSPAATAANWNQVTSSNPDLALTVALPPSNTPAYTIIDSLVQGDGLRVDAAAQADDAAVIAAVEADRGTIGVVSLASASAAGDAIKLVQLNFGDAGCATPSADTIEGRTYSASQPILVYRNTAETGDILTVLNAAVSDNAAATVTAAGFTSPTAATLATMRDGLANGTTGRLYTRTQTTFTIPQSLSGTINVAGSALNSDFVKNLTTAFTGSYSGVTANTTFDGSVSGARRFCNGEVDIISVYAPLTQEQLTNCAANHITPYSVTLGSDAVVLLRNSSDTFAQCLTLAQVATIFDNAANATVTNWNQVDASFPDLPLFAFESSLGASEVNLLLIKATGTNDPGRADAQINSNAGYRAAATGNTSGVISVYSWGDYGTVSASTQTNVTPVQIDGGSGCVAPTEATVSDGTYPLARTLSLIVNQSALTRSEVQSLLWFIFSDTNYTALQSSGLVVPTFASLPETRAQLEEAFTAAAIAAQATPEATPQATSEATSEATAQATVESTAAAAAATTPEAAAQPTAEATAAATPEATAQAGS